MPHIDEGTLHALLDGALRAMEPDRADAVEAHLATCAECRALAAEAARLRGRAGEILGVLEPAVKPDFDEVLVRAGAGGAGAPRLAARLRWTRRVAWAATLVVAVGMGYLIRDQLGPELGVGGGAEPQSAVERLERAGEPEGEVVDPAPGVAGAAGAADVAQQDTDEALPRARPSTPVLEQAAPPAATDEARRQRSLAGMAAPPQVNAPGEVAEEARVEAGELVVTGSAASRDALPLAGADSAPLAGIGAEADAPRLERAAPLANAQASKAFAGAGAVESVRMDGLSGDSVAAAPVYESVAPGDVFDAVGAPLMVLAGADVVWAQVGRRGQYERVVVSLQRFEDGLEVRVTQQPARIALDEVVVTAMGSGQARRRGEAAAPAAAPPAAPAPAPAAAARPDSAPPLPPGRAFLGDLPPGHSRITHPGIWLGWELVVEGPLPEEALRALVREVAPYGGWPGR